MQILGFNKNDDDSSDNVDDYDYQAQARHIWSIAPGT